MLDAIDDGARGAVSFVPMGGADGDEDGGFAQFHPAQTVADRGLADGDFPLRFFQDGRE